MRSPRPILLALALAAFVAPAAGAQGFHVERLRTEYATNPIGIDGRRRDMSWKLHADRRGTRQSAYEIRVAHDERGARERAALELGQGDLGRIDEARLRGPALSPAAATTGRCVCGTTRRRVGVERARVLGDGPAGADATGRRSGSSPTSPKTPRAPIPRRCCAPSSCSPATSRRARVRHQPRSLRDAAERPARRRPGVHAGLDQLRQAAPVPDVRRHRRSLKKGPNAVGAMLGSGWYRGEIGLRGQRATPTATASRCSRRSTYATPADAQRSSTSDERVEGLHRPDPRRPRSTTARRTTRASSRRDGARPASTRSRLDAGRVAQRRPLTTSWRRPARPCGASRRSSRSRSCARPAARPWSTWGRTWSAGCA